MTVPFLTSVPMIKAQMTQVSVVMPSLEGECWNSVYKKSLISVGKSQGRTMTLLRDKWRRKEKWPCQVECCPKGAVLLRLPPHFLVGSRGGGGERWHSIFDLYNSVKVPKLISLLVFSDSSSEPTHQHLMSHTDLHIACTTDTHFPLCFL